MYWPRVSLWNCSFSSLAHLFRDDCGKVCLTFAVFYTLDMNSLPDVQLVKTFSHCICGLSLLGRIFIHAVQKLLNFVVQHLPIFIISCATGAHCRNPLLMLISIYISFFPLQFRIACLALRSSILFALFSRKNESYGSSFVLLQLVIQCFQHQSLQTPLFFLHYVLMLWSKVVV